MKAGSENYHQIAALKGSSCSSIMNVVPVFGCSMKNTGSHSRNQPELGWIKDVLSKNENMNRYGDGMMRSSMIYLGMKQNYNPSATYGDNSGYYYSSSNSYYDPNYSYSYSTSSNQITQQPYSQQSYSQQPSSQQIYNQQPSYQQPTYQQPTYQQPTYQQPTYQQPTYQQPTSQQQIYQQPTSQQPTYQQPTYEQPIYQQPTYQQPTYEQPTYQQPTYEQPPAQQSLPPVQESPPQQTNYNIPSGGYQILEPAPQDYSWSAPPSDQYTTNYSSPVYQQWDVNTNSGFSSSASNQYSDPTVPMQFPADREYVPDNTTMTTQIETSVQGFTEIARTEVDVPFIVKKPVTTYVDEEECRTVTIPTYRKDYMLFRYGFMFLLFLLLYRVAPISIEQNKHLIHEVTKSSTDYYDEVIYPEDTRYNYIYGEFLSNLIYCIDYQEVPETSEQFRGQYFGGRR